MGGTTPGWCDACKSGEEFGVPIKSQTLYKVLDGAAAKDASKLTCPGCKKAAQSNGSCDHCHVYFRDGRQYESRVAYTLAAGKKVSPSALTCDDCRRAASAAGGGYCSGCGVGYVGGYRFEGKQAYEKARAAYATLQTAASAKCGGCATAMVTDGKCEHCNVAFKDGKPTKQE